MLSLSLALSLAMVSRPPPQVYPHDRSSLPSRVLGYYNPSSEQKFMVPSVPDTFMASAIAYIPYIFWFPKSASRTI